MRCFFRFLVSMVFMPTMLLAAGGVTMQYNADVANLKDGDVFYADRHYRAPLDTIKVTINGRLGNSNVASDAKIAVTKIDSTGRLSMDSVVANKGLRTTGTATVDSLKSTKGISATTGDFTGAANVVGLISSSPDATVYSSTGAVAEPSVNSSFINLTSVAGGSCLARYRVNQSGTAQRAFAGLVGGASYTHRFVIGGQPTSASYTEWMSVSRLGVGIGRASSTYALEVNGDVCLENATYLRMKNASGTANAFLTRGVNATDSYDMPGLWTNAALTSTVCTGDFTAFQVSHVVQNLTAANPRTWNINNGDDWYIASALSATLGVAAANASAGTTATLAFIQGSTARAVTFTSTGVVFQQTGGTNACAAGGTLTITAATIATVNAFYTIRLFWATTTLCYVTVS